MNEVGSKGEGLLKKSFYGRYLEIVNLDLFRDNKDMMEVMDNTYDTDNMEEYNHMDHLIKMDEFENVDDLDEFETLKNSRICMEDLDYIEESYRMEECM